MLPRAKLALGPLAFRFAPDRVLTLDRVSGVKLSPHFALPVAQVALAYLIALHHSADLLLLIFCMFASVF